MNNEPITDTDRLDFLIKYGDWQEPGMIIAGPSKGERFLGEWTRHDGRGCDDSITPRHEDPRGAIDLAIINLREGRRKDEQPTTTTDGQDS